MREQQYLTWYDDDGTTPLWSRPAHRLEDEPYRRDRKVWFWIIVVVLIFTKLYAHSWRGWEFSAGRLLLPLFLVYVVGYVAYAIWDRIAWRFLLGGRMRDAGGQRWVIED